MSDQLKLKLPQQLVERLNYYAKQHHTEPDKAVERILERHLPNLMGSFIVSLEKLTVEEQQTMEESFYCVMFMVSYADHHASLKETLKIEKLFQELEKTFGHRMLEILSLEKAHKDQLFDAIKQMSPEGVEARLEKLHKVFEKMPPQLIEDYKIYLLEGCIEVANASGESLLSAKKISDEERIVIQTIARALEIPVLGRHARVLMKADYQSIASFK